MSRRAVFSVIAELLVQLDQTMPDGRSYIAKTTVKFDDPYLPPPKKKKEIGGPKLYIFSRVVDEFDI